MAHFFKKSMASQMVKLGTVRLTTILIGIKIVLTESYRKSPCLVV